MRIQSAFAAFAAITSFVPALRGAPFISRTTHMINPTLIPGTRIARAFLALLIAIALPTAAGPNAGAAGGAIHGTLADEQGKPLAGAAVHLRHPISGYKQDVVTDARGRFELHNIPPDSYRLAIESEGRLILMREVDVHASLPLELKLRISRESDVVQVGAKRGLIEGHAHTHQEIDRTTIEKSPAAVQSRAMESVILTTPGFIKDENGRFHFRGSHGQVSYYIDGVPVTDQVQATFSNSLDPSQVESMSVVTGGIAAEYGGKPVAVIAMTTQSGLATPGGFAGSVSLGASRYSTGELGLTLRGGDDRFGAFVTAASSRSNRFLDPVNFDNLHNTGNTSRAYSRFDWNLGDKDSLRLSLSGGVTRRDVPNLLSQQAAGQNQRIRNTDVNLNGAWNHLFTPNLSFEAIAFYRHSDAKLDPTQNLSPGFTAGGPDFPLWARQERALDNAGAHLALTWRSGRNLFKSGLQYVRYPIRERFEFAITDDAYVSDPADPLHPYTPSGGGAIFRHDESISPSFASVFVQNDLEAGPLSVALGLRHDSYFLRGRRSNRMQPRVGLAWTIETTATVLRASYDRLMITPENENLALTTSQAAWDLGPFTGTPNPGIRPELQNSWLVGVQQQFGPRFRVDLSYWAKDSRNAADNEQFLNTGVLFPIAADKGEFRGWDARLDLVPEGGFSAYLSVGRTRAIFVTPTVGGLQLEESGDPPGTRFLIDHDQRLAVQLGLRYEKRGFFGQLITRHDSGLVSEDPADAAGNPDLEFGIPYVRFDSNDGVFRVKPRTLLDLGLGYDWKHGGRYATQFGLDVQNLTDRKGLYNFLSVFGGTHVIPPRTISGRVKFSF